MSDEIRRINTGDSPISIECTGETHTTWIVDAEEEGTPTPRHFRDLGTAGTKLVVLSTFLPEPYASEAMRIYEDVARLQRMMARERLDDEQAVGNLCLGNLEELPEVEAEREFVSHIDDGNDRSVDTATEQNDIETDGGHPIGAAGGAAHPPERPTRGDQAYLGPDRHLCDICRRTFATLVELANHNCHAPGGVLLKDGGRDA